MNVSTIKKTALALIVITAAASAQFNVPLSARRDAMAGAPMADITDVYRYPALMTGYTDHLQATWGGGIIGIKAMNDVVSIGILANQGLMAPQFATAAAARVNTFFGGAVPPAPIAPDFNTQFNIPHLLLGFDLGTLSVGADIFFEYVGYSAYIDATTDSDYKASIIHPGVKLSAAVDLGSLDLLVKAGIGFPGINAEIPPTTSDKLSSEALYMEGGVEVGMAMGNVDLTIGAGYTRSDYRFKTGNTSDPTAACSSLLAVYLSGEFNFVETAVAVLSYEFLRGAQTNTQPDAGGNPSNMTGIHSHVFTAGVENAWEKAWIFDAAHLRGGLQYTADFAVGKSHNMPVADTDTRYSRPGVHSGITPTLGAGVSKAFFDLDMSFAMGSWAGAFVGPPVSRVTGTIKF